jgi:glycosyltransferase involved in cell wall biosynthesis
MLREKRKTAKFIRVISKSGYNKILEIIGDKYKDKCVVLHMGVSINKFSDKKEKSSEKDKDSFVIGTPANLVEVKGHKYLIEAIKILVQKGYSIKCYFFGNGPLREELEKNVDKMNLKDIIIFEGNVPHDKLLKLYADNEVDCVVLPSIVTDKGVAQKNSDELAKAIMKLMNDEKLREELGEKGFEKVKKEFNLSKIVEELLYLMDTN